jgi:hypothetical protein
MQVVFDDSPRKHYSRCICLFIEQIGNLLLPPLKTQMATFDAYDFARVAEPSKKQN